MEKLERSLKKFNKRMTQDGKDMITSPLSKTFFSRKAGRNVDLKQLFDDVETPEDDQLDDNGEISLTKGLTAEQQIGLKFLPLQMQRKMMKNVFNFNIMVVGETGLGKSTLINSMFMVDIYSNQYPGPSKRASKTLSVESTTVTISEGQVNVQLTVIDTPGFGDSLNNTNCWQPIVDYLDKQHYDYLHHELSLRHKTIHDNRVHCCLYFIQPTGHRLKAIDIDCMKSLHDKVNIIPLIAKADSLTTDELQQFKLNILADIETSKINIYKFPEMIGSSEEETKYFNDLKARVPFGVVSNNHVIEENGRKKYVRKYPWGMLDIENLEYSDFKALRDLLIKHCMFELVDSTHQEHFENFREKNLMKLLKQNYQEKGLLKDL